MEKRGQAAMEFLMTYGWAILAAIVAIAVLAWFGVFSPGRYVSSMCNIAAPLGCDEYSLSSSQIRLRVRNGAGDTIQIANLQVKGCGVYSTAYTVNDGNIADINVTCAGVTGNRFRGDIIVNYTKGAGLIQQSTTGVISGSLA
jgi:uncharacterized protein (UPF0333 family)